MKIADEKSLKDIQQEFSVVFPYLRMEFFKKHHAAGKPSPRKEMLSTTLTVGECSNKHFEGEISISSNMKVNEIESVFWSRFGLSVQIFRKSGFTWLETTATDGWTLEKQNRLGKDLSDFREEPDREEFDNDRTK